MLILLAIGKVVAIILLIAVIVIALVLFLPARYLVRADSREKKAHIRLRWMFGLVAFRAVYLEEFSYGLRIAGIKIFPGDPDKKKKKKAVKKARAVRKKAKKAGNQSDAGSGPAGGGEDEKQEKKKPGIRARIKQGWEIFQSFHSLGISGILFPALQKLLYRIRPRFMRGNVKFGLEDPALTGQICGGLALVPFLFSTDLRICPDFETDAAYFEGDLDMRGNIFVIHLILFALALFKRKEFRRFLSAVRKAGKKAKAKA